ncbi:MULTISPECIES: hypothetical protein [Sphingomonadaceae]|uniref:Uncharacterized protein n=1 Tax=Sphingomonas bisphenolicum TaxID=296544 RepID=A0ABN5WBF4_9SPHN|nr:MULTISPECIES: hypothetical protein [Sphingomonadaceae]MBZ9646586.1 hypothetical protein [Sphingobium sp. 3R8]BBF68315.1 hypothetical protein SBA_ch1_05150 [Sphingomonas bisphenolicum]BBF68317.1 hypothetical protein SBA_ch1_05170 [Sphingomonas bisphenolicum]
MTKTIHTEPMPDVFFDIWFMPAAFWTQWWGFYAETLNVGRLCTPHHPVVQDESPVDIEVEEGLVA